MPPIQSAEYQQYCEDYINGTPNPSTTALALACLRGDGPCRCERRLRLPDRRSGIGIRNRLGSSPVFDELLLLWGETLKLKAAFQESLILNYGLQLQPAAKVGQVEVKIYRVAGVYFSREHNPQAPFAQGDSASWNRKRASRTQNCDIGWNG